jgi:vacuolar-type H+-ATPase subunit I/STV1
MVLEYIRESLEGLADAEKAHYKARENGGFVLEVRDEKDDRVAGLIQNRNAALAEKEKLQRELKQFEGVDPAQARMSAQRIAKLESDLEAVKKSKAGESDVARIKEELQAEYDKRLNEKDAQIKQFEETLLRDAKSGAITRALINAKVRQEAIPMVTAFLETRVIAVRGDTGNVATRVLKDDGSGSFELSTKDTGVYKSPDELIEEMKADKRYGFVFEGSRATGGSADPRQASNGEIGMFDGEFAGIRYKSDLRGTAMKAKFIAYLKLRNGGDGKKASDEYFALPDIRPST